MMDKEFTFVITSAVMEDNNIKITVTSNNEDDLNKVKALAKTYEYDIKNIHKKTDLTKERLDRYVEEMKARKRNVEKLIREFENKEEVR